MLLFQNTFVFKSTVLFWTIWYGEEKNANITPFWIFQDDVSQW